MNGFLESNPRLRSRFNKYVHFEDDYADELVDIFLIIAESNGYDVAKAGVEVLRSYIATLAARGVHELGNGRGVRNLFEKAVQRHANRLVKLDLVHEPSALTTLDAGNVVDVSE